MAKVAILGAGFVGTAAAVYLAERNIADIALIDVVNYGLAAGKALDLSAAAAVRGFSARVTGTDRIEEAEGASVVVNTAGIARKPGMDRMDLLQANAGIAANLAEGVARHAPGAVIINVSNPLDVLCYVFLKKTGFPRERVVGMGGVLDSTRFRAFLAETLDCDPQGVSAMVLGGHGDSMVPIVRTATVGGVPAAELLSGEELARAVARTRTAGADVLHLLKTGSAFSSTGAAVFEMVEACLVGRKKLLPASAWLEGEYGLEGVYLGVPVMLGQGGVERIVEMELTPEEEAALRASADEVRAGIEAVKGIIG
ncbi:MAG: malate dehydrogenase [Planctomycetota bacterium]